MLEHDLTAKSDRQLSDDWEIFFAEAAAFSLADWNMALNLTGKLAAEGRSAAAELALKSIVDYFATGQGEQLIEQAPQLFARLSGMTLRIVRDARGAVALAQRGLAALAAGEAGERASAIGQRLLVSLTAAEIAAAEAMLADNAVPARALREAVGEILGRDAALTYANRFALLRLAHRLCQEQPAYGSRIIAALARLPPPAEPSGPDGPRRRGELYLRLSQSTLRFLKAPKQAAQLAQQGLEALPAGEDEKLAALRQRLLESLGKAATARKRQLPGARLLLTAVRNAQLLRRRDRSRL